MKKAIAHLRGNVVAYLALFVALGGTGYAAISIPRNSVGTRQLQNGAVTQAKLDKRSIAGSVVFWADISRNGTVISSSKPASTTDWASGHGEVVFPGKISNACFAVGNVDDGNPGSLSLTSGPSIAGSEHLAVTIFPIGSPIASPLAIAVAEICPS